MSADLHIHTNYSDGFLTPKKVVEVSHQIGLKTISITDHDTVAGIDEAIAAAKNTDIEVIPGIELNTHFGKQEIHILGYFIDYKNEAFNESLKESRVVRAARAKQIVEKLQHLDVSINFSEVERIASGSSIGRPHIARLLCDHGYADSVQHAFNKYLRVGAPAYVDLIKWDTFEAIEAINNIGGIPVLAHPGSYTIDHLIPQFVEKGLKGIEVFCLKHTIQQIKKYQKLAEENKLLITGGSDFHNAIDALYDTILGTMPLEDIYINKLKKYAAENKKSNQ